MRSVGSAFASALKGDFSGLSGIIKSISGGKEFASLGASAGSAVAPTAALGAEVSGLASASTGAAAALGPVGVAIGATVVVGLAAVAVTAALGAKFLQLAKEGSDLGGKFLDLSNNTGVAVEALSKYKIEAEQSGSSLDAITSAIEKLEKKLIDAASGQEKSAKLFKALGINAKEAAENPQAAFDQLAVSIANIEDPALRVKVATELFGKSGANLISTFITMRDEGGALKARMAELGLTLSGDVVAGADAVGDEFVILQAISDSLKIKIANELAPDVVRAVQAMENAFAALAPMVISVGGTIVDMFTTTVNMARTAAASIKGFFANASGGASGAVAGAIAGYAGEAAAIKGEAQSAEDARAMKVLEQSLKNVGMGLDGKPLEDKNKDSKIKGLMDALKKKPRGAGATQSEITPTDTSSSIKQLREAELGQQSTLARQSVAIAKNEADEKRKILDASYADRLTSTAAYFDQRRAMEAEAIERETAEQQRLIKVEEQRQVSAEADLQKEIARIEKLEAVKLAKAKTPAQKAAINEDQSNRILNAQNQAEAERFKSVQKQIEADTKITELSIKRQGQAAATSREELKANRELQKSFDDLLLAAQAATGDEFGAAATEIGQKFTDKIALAIREGRPDVIAAIKSLTEVELAKARGAEANKTETIIRAGADQEQARIQNELNQGIISEVTARRQQIEVQARYREAIVAEMEVQREAALAANDYVKAAQIAVDIERQRGAGLEEDSNVRAIRDSLTNSFDDFEKSLVYGQKTIGEALRELARSTITSILEQVQQSIVENLTGEKTIGAAIAKAISGKLGGLFKIGQQQTLPGATGEDASKLVIKNLVGNRETLSKNIEDLGNKTVEAARVAAEKQAQELAKIAQSNMEMANCACAPAPQQGILGQVLGAVIGAVGAGIAGGGGGGGGGKSGGYPAGWQGMSQGYKKDGGMVAFADAGGMCGGGHVGTAAGYAAVGKMIRGPGGPRDDKIPMWLSDGEYVTDAATVDKLGPEFFRMLPAMASAGKMADGGFVADMLGGGSNASQPLPMPRSEARNQQQGKTISVVNHFVIQAPRGSVSAETQQQILTKAAMGMNAALARNA